MGESLILMAADRGPVTLAVTVVSTVLAAIFVVARLVTRTFLVRSFRHEDWWILAAWVIALCFSSSICVAVHFGLGLHEEDVGSPARHTALKKAEYAFSILYNPSLLLTKNSIIVFYLNVMSKDVDPIFRWCNWLVLVLVNVGGVAFTFLNIFRCRPISSTVAYPLPEHAGCNDIVALYLSSAPLNIITDLAILLLPMPILTSMRMPRKQKIILIVTFGFGIFVAAVDVVRIAYLQSALIDRLAAVDNGNAQDDRTSTDDDLSWYTSLSFMWSAVEVNTGIICACVPVLKPLFMRFLPGLVRTSRSKQSHSVSGRDGLNKRVNIELVVNEAGISHDPSLQVDCGNFASSTSAGRSQGIETCWNVHGDSKSDETSQKNSTSGIAQVRWSSAPDTALEFDLVNINRTKNMLLLSNRESIPPLAIVILVFLLWGFAYGLLDTLNSRFEDIAHVSDRKALGLHASYFVGYFVGPLTLGQYILRKHGFKASMMVGLCIYGCGVLAFWPSAVLTSYPAFMISNLIVGAGLSCLEIAANPYVALCGPSRYAEVRLTLSQAVQAIGTVVAAPLAQKVLFKDSRATGLVNVQWAYLGIAFLCIGMAVAFYYIALPEASDTQLQQMADWQTAINHMRIGPYSVIWVTLFLGVLSQWLYVGGQEVIRGTTQSLYTSVNRQLSHPSGLTASDFQTISYGTYTIGRFLSGFLALFLPPRYVLLLLYAGVVMCSGLQISVHGKSALAVNQLIYLFESGLFSLIFAITLRGMGRHTKLASMLITAAISGGAVFPVVQWAVENRVSLESSFVVPLIVFALGCLFPLYLNILPMARNQVDTKSQQGSQRQTHDSSNDPCQNMARSLPENSIDLNVISTAQKAIQNPWLTAGPTVEHIERQTDREYSSAQSA